MLYDGDTFEHKGFKFRFGVTREDYMGPPWEEYDGHGPVRKIRSYYGKSPGERVLWTDGYDTLLYDFAEAVKIAKRDGWGYLPYRMKIEPIEGEFPPGAQRGGTVTAGPYSAFDPDNFNKAIREVFAAHKATFPSANAYAAAAAEHDFERLRAWCNNEWEWLDIHITLLDAEGNETDEEEIIGGVDTYDDSYVEEVAKELADEIISRIGEDTKELIIPEVVIPETRIPLK